ncbi:hypothetical protein [uncultured Chryseobacterium sp.]|uniref:hypothetical protein n=1 Tax=uncultured Chryseobacterium sp. TaxID=259322 RepID=UPI0025EFE57A|nr:hypothetical protein [uncultured Chryseobacterium sp.]
MKNVMYILLLAGAVTACTKSETQHPGTQNEGKNINDAESDTIRNLNEVSDTARLGKDSVHIQTDNE